jgi:hypothetical protein
MLPCAYKELFGIECPTCGAQRSFSLLMEGNFSDSFFMYPPLLPILLLGVLWIMKLAKPTFINFDLIKKYSWAVLAIVMINYVVHFLL